MPEMVAELLLLLLLLPLLHARMGFEGLAGISPSLSLSLLLSLSLSPFPQKLSR